jgi:hypothetical protein
MVDGPAYRKMYRNVYDRGRLRKRRVYRIPLLSELEAAMERVAQAAAKVA